MVLCCLGTLVYFLGLIGTLRLGYELYKILIEAYPISKIDVKNVYNKNGSYAIITGSTNGIGLSYMKYLASQGFNLVCIARKEALLKQRESEILELYPKIKIVNITKDFKEAYKAAFYDEIAQKTKDLDIAVLVNNVGMSTGPIPQEITELDEQVVKDTIVVNSHSQVGMMHTVVPKMIQRKQRSAVITVSSVAHHMSINVFGVYGCSKIFTNYISIGLGSRRFGGAPLDFLDVSPGLVTTNMTSEIKKSLISPEDPDNVPASTF